MTLCCFEVFYLPSSHVAVRWASNAENRKCECWHTFTPNITGAANRILMVMLFFLTLHVYCFTYLLDPAWETVTAAGPIRSHGFQSYCNYWEPLLRSHSPCLTTSDSQLSTSAAFCKVCCLWMLTDFRDREELSCHRKLKPCGFGIAQSFTAVGFHTCDLR